jgi:serine/threonine-protein kinase
MIELRTLGAIDLRDGAGERIESVLRHSKRLSLLVYLCAAHPVQSQRRDTLVALLWPELDETHARAVLRQELSQLRLALGRDALQGERSETLGVNTERVWCDVCAFEEALHAGRLEDALKLWLGDFLPGIHIPGGEFDRWVDGARTRLARKAVNAADRLRAQADERRDVAGAVRWGRRLVELAPYDETAWHHLLLALDRAGDRAGALTAYGRFATQLRDELEVEPSPETRALADRIRERTTAAPGIAGDVDSDEDSRESIDAGTLPPSPVVVALRPVENLTGDPRHDPLGQRLADSLSIGITNLDFAEVLVGDNVEGVTGVVSATLYERSSRVEVRTRLSAPGEADRILAVPEPVLLDPDAEDEAIQSIVARVLAAVASQFHPNMPIMRASGRPHSVPSWRAFLEFIQGSEAFGACRFEEAARRLQKAYEIDQGFLRAAIFAGTALAYAGDPAGADALVAAALDGAAFASDYERCFGNWLCADLNGRRAEAYRAAMDLARLSAHPPTQGIAAMEALKMNRPAEAARLMVGVGPDLYKGWWRNWTPVYEWFGSAYHLLGDHREELQWVMRGRERLPESLDVIRVETRARAALGEGGAVLELVKEALTLPRDMASPADVAWTAAQELDAHGGGDAGEAARRAGLSWLASGDTLTRADRLLQVRLLIELGDLDAAQQQFDALGPVKSLDALGLAALLAARSGETTGAFVAIAQLENMRNPYLSGSHLLHAAGAQAALGQTELAIDTLRRAMAAGLRFGVGIHALPILRPLSECAEFAALLRPRG